VKEDAGAAGDTPSAIVAPMKILLVSHMYPTAKEPASGIFVKRLEDRLRSRGHLVRRVVIKHRIRGGGIRSYVRRANYVLFSVRALLAAHVFRPDVAYVHCFGQLLRPLARGSRVPIVAHLHGQDVENLGSSLGPPAEVAEELCRRVTRFIAVSEWLRERFVAKLPQAAANTIIVSCGVDVSVFNSRPAPAPPIVFLCIGALNERKNVIGLARAFAIARRDGERLRFVGVDEDGLERALRQIEGVDVIAPLSSEGIAELIAQAHVICQPSTREPFGLGALEGMASGRSVVGTLIGGHREFVPGNAGVLVDPGDIDAIAAALRTAADRLPIPNNAAVAAAKQHDLDFNVARVEAALREALESGRS
jgi:glycosyltransferase involved in cell wall biosynthesis